MVDSFIGSRFGADSQVEVISWLGYRRLKKDKLYLIKCHKCAEDPELWGDGTFEYTKGHLNEGKLPCGCTKTIYWTKEQYVTRVKRECLERGHEFIGFAEDYRNNKTKITLKCKKDGNVWSSTQIAGYLYGAGCPTCGTESLRGIKTKSDGVMIESFMKSGSFDSETKFWRSKRLDSIGRPCYWHHTCSKCSSDEMVAEGLCDGVFETTSSGLQGGAKSCRCSKTYTYSREQQEYRLKNAGEAHENTFTFSRWATESTYAGNETKARLTCSLHGEWVSSVSSIVNVGTGCPSCSKGGFRPALDGYIYVLRADARHSSFTGYGISNVPERRFRDHRKSLADHGFSITDSEVFLVPTGKYAAEVELNIRGEFPRNRQEVSGFIYEATYAHHYKDVISFVQQSLDSYAHLRASEGVIISH